MGKGTPDIVLDGIEFELFHSPDATSYEKSWERREHLDQTVWPQSARNQVTSRAELPQILQTTWSGGSTWWKPILSESYADTYADASNMDTFSTPGLVFPTNQHYEVSLNLGTGPMISAEGDLYAQGLTQAHDATYFDVVKWDPASNNWVAETGYSSGINSSLYGGVYDGSDGYIYLLGETQLSRYNPTTSSFDAAWLSPTTRAGDNIFLTADGKVWVYTEGVLKEIDKDTPSFITRKDDGFGPDILRYFNTTANSYIQKYNIKLAVAGANGVFYVKNTYNDGAPRAILARVERDQSGSYIRYPLTDFPKGFLVFNIALHQGSVIVAGTFDWRLLLDNDSSVGETPRVDIWHYTPGKGGGAIGSPDRSEPTEFPGTFIGARGHWLLLASGERVWVYDSIRGGLHPWIEVETGVNGNYTDSVSVLNSVGKERLLIKTDTDSFVTNSITDDAVTVVNFGDDLTTYVLESNYFDFGRPHEDKTLLTVRTSTEDMDSSAQYTIFIEVDDGAWASVATHGGGASNVSFSETDITSTLRTGKRFRYKIVYETKNGNRYGFRGISFTAAAGEMVPVWTLRLNGHSIRNARNVPSSLRRVLTDLETSAAKQVPITLVDNYETHLQELDSTTTSVLLRRVNIIKGTAGEAVILVEAQGY